MIIITGGLGFIGSHVARQLLDAGEDVCLTRHRAADVPDFLAAEVGRKVRVEPLDVTDPAAVTALLRRYPGAGVVHLATAPRSGISPVAEMRAGYEGLLSILEGAAEAGAGRVSVASSVVVYGNPVEPPAREDQPLAVACEHPIGASKLAQEATGGYLARELGLDVIFLRIGIIYGPGYRTMLNAPARLAQLAAGRADRVAGLPDPLAGHPGDSWDLCYVSDCARAVALLATAAALPNRTYNVGSGALTTLGELAAAANAAAPGAELAVKPPARAAHAGGAPMPIGRLSADTGFRPQWDTARAMADYVQWLGSHER